MHKLTDRDRLTRALEYAEQLAVDLRVLGYPKQASIVDEIKDGIYSAKLNKAVQDLARR